MPSDQSTWLIAVPDKEGLLQELSTKLTHQSRSFPKSNISEIVIPSFKTGTLDLLISLSEELPKQEQFATITVAKIVDTLRNLLNNDPSKLAQHILVNERPVDEYVLSGWKWNEGRYGIHRSLRELVDILNKEIAAIDSALKAKLNNYNLVKGSLVQIQRKKTGNLSVRSLADIVLREHFVQDSEYLETVLVAVPRNALKEWNGKYERLNSMVVPRSAMMIAQDEEYTLFAVVIFRRVHDDFVQKCRENKYIVRDFVYSEEALVKQRAELDVMDKTEKELWTELLRVSRTHFSEAFQILVHFKVIRLFVESVLRYGLPANYAGLIIKPESKSIKKTLSVLTAYFAYLGPKSSGAKAQTANASGGGEEFIGEYQSLMDQEFFDFVMFEIPWIVD